MRLGLYFMAAIVVVLGIVSSTASAGQGCGCEATCQATCTPCVRRCHHHRHCCSAAPIDRSAMLPPAGPVYEAVAVPRMAAVPVMPQYALVSSVQPYAAADVRTEATCADSHERLDVLESRVNSMRSELNEIRETMKVQLEILRELKTRLPPAQ